VNAPHRVNPTSLADYLDAMSRAVFSSGISWRVIEAKWDGIRPAFDGFDPERIAAYTPDDVDRLMADTRVVRNRQKIEATIANAGELIVTDREFGGFDNYLRSFPDNDALVGDLHARFKFLGVSVAHMFLYGVSFDMQAQEAWAHEHFANAHHRR
jgi:3-methyladenine DNA glycosylase Tag